MLGAWVVASLEDPWLLELVLGAQSSEVSSVVEASGGIRRHGV
jgi:hypothetical protein